MGKLTKKEILIPIILIIVVGVIAGDKIYRATDVHTYEWTSDSGLSKDVRIENFIKEYGISDEDAAVMGEDRIYHMMTIAENGNFTKRQIKSEIDREISYGGVSGTLSEDGKYYTYPNGWTMPNLHFRYDDNNTAFVIIKYVQAISEQDSDAIIALSPSDEAAEWAVFYKDDSKKNVGFRSVTSAQLKDIKEINTNQIKQNTNYDYYYQKYGDTIEGAVVDIRMNVVNDAENEYFDNGINSFLVVTAMENNERKVVEFSKASPLLLSGVFKMDNITADMLAVDWIGTDVTIDSIEKDKKYISKEIDDVEGMIRYNMGTYYYNFYESDFWGDDLYGVLKSVVITETTDNTEGPLGIHIGDSKENLSVKYPNTFTSDPELMNNGNYVLHVGNLGPDNESEIRFVPESITPMVSVVFKDDKVCRIRISYDVN